jgi:hopanoid biosynthesis associated protein HpnK
MKTLIISADDFGLIASVNEAVELAHREGLLAAASLMVAEPLAADAVARARANPGLKVGLHLVLVEGKSVLPHREIPALVDEAGRFSGNQVALGFKYFFRPGIRAQLAKEIRAQYLAFAATGLPLDHVNAHKHMHLHPTVANLAIKIGREFGLQAIRLPREMGGNVFLSLWCKVLRRMARRAGLITNDQVVGLSHSGHFLEPAFLQALAILPDGITEAYFHPATSRDPAFAATMALYDHPGELQALLSVAAKQYIEANGIRRSTYSDLNNR